MRRHFLHTLLLFCCVLGIISCQQQDCPQPQGSASLFLSVKSPYTDISRGVQDLNDDGIVSDEELYLDGQKMYRLGVFLMDGNSVVAFTVLESDDTRFTNDNTEAVVSFENLNYSKTYELYAVANYGDHGVLKGNLPSVSSGNIASELKVTSSSDNICHKDTVYPISLRREVKLNPGVNTINGELLRTYARLRINVRNQSAEKNLYITQLSFPSKFVQKSADLFSEGGTASASPVVTSTGAIVPFEQDKEIAKITDAGTVNEATIFDTYLLESNGGSYDYTLGLKYSGGIVENVYTVNTTTINDHSKIEDDAMYVIYHKNTKKYLFANGNSVGSGDSYLTNGQLNHNYVWKFNETGDNMYTIESMGASGYYMQSSGIDGNRVPLVVNASSDYFTASTSSNTIYLKSTATNRWGYAYYMAVNGTIVCGNTSGNGFYLYKVEATSGAAGVIQKVASIPINIVDKVTGEAKPLQTIRRNDFIDILVNVTYNEKAGDIEFKVSDWDVVDGDVTFD